MTDALNLRLDSRLFDYQPGSVSGKSVLSAGGITGTGRVRLERADILYVLTQGQHSNVVALKIRPHLQWI